MRNDSQPSAERPARTLKSRAIACLARREYGRAELRERLLGAGRREVGGPSAAEVETVLDELVALGLLSDARYAHALVTRKAGTCSRRALAETLKAHGVAEDAAREALGEVEVDDDVAMAALWQRRFGAPPRDDRDKARQVRFLQSRGFALSAILRLLRNPPRGHDPGAA